MADLDVLHTKTVSSHTFPSESTAGGAFNNLTRTNISKSQTNTVASAVV